MLVPGTGLEPARLAALDPKSSASANSAIPASRNPLNCSILRGWDLWLLLLGDCIVTQL